MTLPIVHTGGGMDNFDDTAGSELFTGYFDVQCRASEFCTLDLTGYDLNNCVTTLNGQEIKISVGIGNFNYIPLNEITAYNHGNYGVTFISEFNGVYCFSGMLRENMFLTIYPLGYNSSNSEGLEHIWLNSDDPNYPTTPVNPENPDDPDTPVNPENPDDPDTPVNPENPDDPDIPVNPENPENTIIGYILTGGKIISGSYIKKIEGN